MKKNDNFGQKVSWLVYFIPVISVSPYLCQKIWSLTSFEVYLCQYWWNRNAQNKENKDIPV